MKITQEIGGTIYASNGKWYRIINLSEIKLFWEIDIIRKFLQKHENYYYGFIIKGLKKINLKIYHDTQSIVDFPNKYDNKGFYQKKINRHYYLGFIEETSKTKRGGSKIRIWQELPYC